MESSRGWKKKIKTGEIEANVFAFKNYTCVVRTPFFALLFHREPFVRDPPFSRVLANVNTQAHE